MSRDLEAIHASWGERFGPAFDTVREVAEAVELYDLLERAAMSELLRLEDAAQGSTTAKIKCIWAARAMREARVDILGGVGLIGASVPSKNRLPRAAEIRAILHAARTEEREFISDAEREWCPTLADRRAPGGG